MLAQGALFGRCLGLTSHPCHLRSKRSPGPPRLTFFPPEGRSCSRSPAGPTLFRSSMAPRRSPGASSGAFPSGTCITGGEAAKRTGTSRSYATMPGASSCRFSGGAATPARRRGATAFRPRREPGTPATRRSTKWGGKPAPSGSGRRTTRETLSNASCSRGSAMPGSRASRVRGRVGRTASCVRSWRFPEERSSLFSESAAFPGDGTRPTETCASRATASAGRSRRRPPRRAPPGRRRRRNAGVSGIT